MYTTYEMIGLEDAEKKLGLVSFTVKPAECKTQFTITEPRMKKQAQSTLIHDRGRKRKEKGKLF